MHYRPDHSVACFAIKLMLANIRGMFNKVNGTIHYDADDVGRSSVELRWMRSMTTASKRDDHFERRDADAAYPASSLKAPG
jgi:polyisoprenoid-binding protein YceI